RARQALDAAQRRFSVGSATRSDVLRSELELNTAQQSLLTEQTNQNTAGFALGRLVGFDGRVTARTDGPVEPKPLTVEDAALVAEISSSAPVVLAAEGSARASEAGVSAARSRWLPSLQLSTGYDWGTTGVGTTSGMTNWSVRLGLSYPLFDGFVRDEAVERARVQDHVANTQFSDTRRMVRSEAERALGQVKLAKERIALAEKAVEVGAEDLRVQQERYGLGVSTILDLLQSQTSLVEAETNLVTARFDYQLARAELEALAGRKL
ncbi:MAG: TolC family protein, partial [Myxococcaceae bacterium]